jgi:hypothetical protein
VGDDVVEPGHHVVRGLDPFGIGQLAGPDGAEQHPGAGQLEGPQDVVARFDDVVAHEAFIEAQLEDR